MRSEEKDYSKGRRTRFAENAAIRDFCKLIERSCFF